jgi:trk system potassium uptake protein TrkH
LGIVAFSTFAITWNILPLYGNAARSLRASFFQVAAIITTTGFGTADFDLWPTFSKVVLVLLMFIGACSSSTAGGLKISRVLILVKSTLREIRSQIHPREVRMIRCDGTTVDRAVAHGVAYYFALYILILLFSSVLISFNGMDFTSTVTSVITCLNNIGPGLGKVGPSGNFADLSVLSKLVLIFDMLAGRLEIYPLIITLSPAVWRRRA